MFTFSCSLKASIAFQRPDLTFDDIGSESPIPLNPPPRHFAGLFTLEINSTNIN